MSWTEGWHLCQDDATLAWGDGRQIVVGETLTVEVKPEIGKRGLHAAANVVAAKRHRWLYYKNRLCRVRLGGQIEWSGDTAAATERTCLAMLSKQETFQLLRRWEIWCIQPILHLLDEPYRHAVSVAEAWCDGTATDKELLASQPSRELGPIWVTDDWEATSVATRSAKNAVVSLTSSPDSIVTAGTTCTYAVQAAVALDFTWDRPDDLAKQASYAAIKATQEAVTKGAAWDAVWEAAWEAAKKQADYSAWIAASKEAFGPYNDHLDEMCLRAIETQESSVQQPDLETREE